MASSWFRIRLWEARPADEDTVTYRNRYTLEHLIGQIAAGTARPTYLPEFDKYPPIAALLLAWMTTCCFVRSAPAVDGSNLEWSKVLYCSADYVPEVLEQLVRDRWLIRRPRFARHPGTGRSGEEVVLFELASWYRPGLRLKNAWLNRCAERGLYAHWLHENEMDRPICRDAPAATTACQKDDPDPSAIQSRILNTRACARTRARARTDGTCGALKESSQATTVVEAPPTSAPGADGPAKESSQATTVVEKRPEGAADQAEIASGVPSACANSRPNPISRYADREPDFALVNRAAADIDDARRLTDFSRKFGELGSRVLAILAAGSRGAP